MESWLGKFWVIEIALLYLYASSLDASPSPFSSATRVRLGVGTNQVISIPGVSRIAVGNSKILRAKAIPPNSILLTGLATGWTSLQTWKENELGPPFEVEVLSSEIIESLQRLEGSGVIKVSLELVELEASVSSLLGVRWPEAIHFASAGVIQTEQLLSGINHTITFQTAPAWIQHLCRQGWAKILARPDLYVRLGEQAHFHSGGEIPVQASIENYGRNQRHVEWKPYGLTIRVKPQSGDKYRIRSEISIEISEVDASVAVNGVPALTRRHLETKMDSLEGETVLLSGLSRHSQSHTEEGLPWLSKIPLLGSLFRWDQDSRRSTEVLIAVTFSLTSSSRNHQELMRRNDRIQQHEERPLP